MLASGLDDPTWKIDPEEAKGLRECTERVARHYATFAVSEKIMDHLALVMAIGRVYGTRAFVTMANKRRAERSADNHRPIDGRPTLEMVT